MVNPKDWMVKIFPTFPQRLIDIVCCLAQMYKVELTVGAVSNRTDDTTPREAQLETAPTTREAIRTRCTVSGTAGDFFNGQPKRLDG